VIFHLSDGNTACDMQSNNEAPSRPISAASARSNLPPALAASLIRSISFAVLAEAHARNDDHEDASTIKPRPAQFAKASLCRGSCLCATCGAIYLKNKSNRPYQEAKGHGRNCRTDPGEKGSFIGGVGRCSAWIME
jgi:hypothetical protein